MPTRSNSASVTADNFTHLEMALYKHLMERRGPDPAHMSRGQRYPATTNLDVMELAARWTKEVFKASVDDQTDRIRRKAWFDCVTNVHNFADVENAPDATFAHNKRFWECVRKTAIWLDTRKLRPNKWDLWWASVDKAVHGLPHTFASAASASGQVASNALNTAGDAASAIGRGLADFLGEPLLIAAVLVGGAILLPPVVRAFRN